MPVKPKYIKDLGTQLLEEYPKVFGRDFEHNKEAVSELTNIESKTVRNRLAGYIARQKAIENRPSEPTLEEE